MFPPAPKLALLFPFSVFFSHKNDDCTKRLSFSMVLCIGALACSAKRLAPFTILNFLLYFADCFSSFPMHQKNKILSSKPKRGYFLVLGLHFREIWLIFMMFLRSSFSIFYFPKITILYFLFLCDIACETARNCGETVAILCENYA